MSGKPLKVAGLLFRFACGNLLGLSATRSCLGYLLRPPPLDKWLKFQELSSDRIVLPAGRIPYPISKDSTSLVWAYITSEYRFALAVAPILLSQKTIVARAQRHPVTQ